MSRACGFVFPKLKSNREFMSFYFWLEFETEGIHNADAVLGIRANRTLKPYTKKKVDWSVNLATVTAKCC